MNKFIKIMRILIGLIFYSCLLIGCEGGSKSEKSVVDSLESCSILDSYSIVVDSNFLASTPTDSSTPYPKFEDAIIDVGHEGYPEVLSNLDYFVEEELTLSPCVKLLIICGKLPEDYSGNEVSNFKSVFLRTIDNKGVQIDNFLLGKINESADISSRVTSKMNANRIIRTEIDKWTSANGDSHLEEKTDTFLLDVTGFIIRSLSPTRYNVSLRKIYGFLPLPKKNLLYSRRPRQLYEHIFIRSFNYSTGKS